jgi:hypothetical protein
VTAVVEFLDKLSMPYETKHVTSHPELQLSRLPSAEFTHHQHRGGRVADNPLCGAAEPNALQSRVTVRRQVFGSSSEKLDDNLSLGETWMTLPSGTTVRACGRN